MEFRITCYDTRGLHWSVRGIISVGAGLSFLGGLLGCRVARRRVGLVEGWLRWPSGVECVGHGAKYTGSCWIADGRVL